MPKSRLAVVWIFIIFYMTFPAYANSFSDLDTAYVSSVSHLPTIDDSRLRPDKDWEPSYDWVQDHCRRKYNPYFIYGWIDIVNFKEMAEINGTYYINNSPSDAAIIRYETNTCTLGYPRFKARWVYKLDTYIQNNQLVARLTATAILYYYYDGIKYYDNITKVFYDYEQIPLQYPASSIPRLIIHESNSNTKILEVNTDETVSLYNVKSKNGSVTKFIKIGQIAYTNKGVPYANFSITDHTIWNSTGYGIYHQGNDIILDSSNFSFSARTPFGNNVSEANITKMIHQPSSMSILNILIFIMLGMGYVACKLAWKVAKI